MGEVIIIDNPKYPHNVGTIVRAAACFGQDEIRMTGSRVSLEPHAGYRLPREERMRDYRTVGITRTDRPFDNLTGTPVCVELVPGAVDLPFFDHPDDAVYVFGPEDGSVSAGLRRKCHLFVKIPMLHCANIAAAVFMVLYDRHAKAVMAGATPLTLLSGAR